MTNAIGLIESKGLVALFEAADVILKNSPVKILGVHKLNNGLISLAISGNSDYVKAAIESGSEAGRKVGEIYAFSVVENPDKKLLNLFSELFSDSLNEKSEFNFIAKIQDDKDDADNVLDPKVLEERADSKRAKSKPLLVTKVSSVWKNKTSKENPDAENNKSTIKKFKKNKSAKQNIDDVVTDRSDNKSTYTNSDNEEKLSTIERLRLEALGLADKNIKANEKTHVSSSKSLVEKHKSEILEQDSVDFYAIEKMNVHKLRHYAREFSNFPIKGRAISRASRNELVELFKSLSNT
jgi:microcompartment protein CcmL/EutN